VRSDCQIRGYALWDGDIPGAGLGLSDWRFLSLHLDFAEVIGILAPLRLGQVRIPGEVRCQMLDASS